MGDEAAKILNAETEYIGLDMKCLIKQFSMGPKRKTCQILQVATAQKEILFDLDAVLSFIRSKRGKKVFNFDNETEYKIKQKLRQSNIQKEGGLATIARFVTKQRLMKKEQLSNWARRPLRADQVKYAAKDAKIEIDIFQVLEKQYPKLLSEKNWTADLSCF